MIADNPYNFPSFFNTIDHLHQSLYLRLTGCLIAMESGVATGSSSTKRHGPIPVQIHTSCIGFPPGSTSRHLPQGSPKTFIAYRTEPKLTDCRSIRIAGRHIMNSHLVEHLRYLCAVDFFIIFFQIILYLAHAKLCCHIFPSMKICNHDQMLFCLCIAQNHFIEIPVIS